MYDQGPLVCRARCHYPWHPRQSRVSLGALDDLLSHPATKACLENSQGALKAMSSLGLLGGRKNVGILLDMLFHLKS